MKTLIKEGRVTPKYKGYFVSCWKKVDGVNTPYCESEIGLLEVRTVDGTIFLDKEYLLRNKVLKTENVKGKLGFRIKADDPVLEQL